MQLFCWQISTFAVPNVSVLTELLVKTFYVVYCIFDKRLNSYTATKFPSAIAMGFDLYILHEDELSNVEIDFF